MTKKLKSLKDYISEYEDSVEYHEQIKNEFIENLNSLTTLKDHRDFIEESYRNGIIYGHGNREFHYMWKLLVDEMTKSFKFLEIGIYKGQIISLIQLISNKYNKKPTIVGVTPLFDPTFANYNRLPWIENLYKQFELTMENTTIYDGLSTNQEIVSKVKEHGLFDIVFVDGDHSYEGAKFDIETYGEVLKPGGYMIVDDASNYKNIAGNGFKGIIEVSDAVKDTLEQNPNYKEVLTVSHDRIFLKIK